MQFSRLFLAAAATVGVHATVILTDSSYAGITANVPFEITWADADGPVTLVLVNDANPNNVLPVETLASGLTGTSYEWTPSPTLINLADYAIQISDSVTTNYGAEFQFLGGATASSNGASSTPGSSLASSSSTATTTSSTSSTSSSSSTTTSAPSSSPTTSTASSTSFANSTTSSSSQTSSAASTTSSAATTSQTSAPSAGNVLASPIALILLTVAALISLN